MENQSLINEQFNSMLLNSDDNSVKDLINDYVDNSESKSMLNKLNEEEKQSFLDLVAKEETTTETEVVSSESLGFIGNQEKPVEDTTSVDLEALAKEQEKARLINEHNARVMKSPEYRAQVVFENYVNTCGRILSGPEKRRLRRQFLTNAKKGMYDYLFDEEKMKKREERMKAKFEKMNKPVVHTVDEIPQKVQEELLSMVDLSTNDVVNDLKS